MNRTIRCQASILDKQREHVLLVKHQNIYGHHYWWLPGGGLELHEDQTSCIRREVREELGIEIEILDVFRQGNVLLRRGYQQYATFICLYSGSLESLNYEDNVRQKILEARWYRIDDEGNWQDLFSDEDIYPFMRELEKWLNV